MKPPELVFRLFPTRGRTWLFLGSVVAAIAIGCFSLDPIKDGRSQAAEQSEAAPVESDEPIQPIEELKHLDARKVALGRKLFHDPRLSHDERLSCASCHVLRLGGSDSRVKSIGINGAVGALNAPTVLNSGFNFSQFWDGRAETLEDQIGEPIQSAIEMGSSWPEVIGKLSNAPEYTRAFREIYGAVIHSAHVKNAIAEFERSLATPNSRFDQFLRHSPDVLTSQEQEGYRLFKSLGCASCHQGSNVGGNMFQRLGVMGPYFTDRGGLNKADFGRFNVTGDPRDKFMFKVPSLRNVALTAPYFHDGSAQTLSQAVGIMAKYQLGRPLTALESELIVSFLKTLTGELDGQHLG